MEPAHTPGSVVIPITPTRPRRDPPTHVSCHPMPARPRLAIFLSGSGRTLLNIHEHIRNGSIDAELALVVASRECLGAQRARDLNLTTLIKPGNIPAHDFDALMRDHRINHIILAGYLRLLSFPPAYRGRILNIHPALLPSFGGQGMYGRHVHEAVLRAGCKLSGCTVHFCDDRYDTGAILLQRCCPVLDDDTPDTLAARVFDLEKDAYVDAIRALTEDRVVFDDTDSCARARIVPPESAR